MRKAIIRLAALSIMVVAGVSGCASHNGDKFVGWWQDVNEPKLIYDIRREGDGFVMRQRNLVRYPESPGPFEFPATLNGDTLILHGPSFNTVVTIDPSSGNLLIGDRFQQAKRAPDSIVDAVRRWNDS